MPTFSIPNSINPGDASDATKAMANWNQIVNDLNTAFPSGSTEPALSTWKTFIQVGVQVGAAVSTTQYFAVAGAASTWQSSGVLVLPADLTAGSRTTNWRLRWAGVTNAVAPGITFTGAMYLANTTIGGSGSPSTISKTGSALAGSTFTWVTPAGSTASGLNTTSTFAIGVQPLYVIAMDMSAGTAANSVTQFIVSLQYQQV